MLRNALRYFMPLVLLSDCRSFTISVPYNRIASTPFITKWSSIVSRSIEQNIHDKCALSLPAFPATMTGDDVIEEPRKRPFIRIPILERTHEKVVAIVFAGLSAAILYLADIHREMYGLSLSEPGKWLVMAETSLALVWSSMVLAISFLEAWTKFRAPFLRKYIAVDVGRHVFASLNAAESGIAASFWLNRVYQCYQVKKITGGALLFKTKAYYEQFSFTLPAAATLSLLLQMIIVSPKLYQRAKNRILEGFNQGLPSVKITMTVAERTALSDIANDLRNIKRVPSRTWHGLYVILEMIKIGCLKSFVVLSWLKLLGHVVHKFVY